MSGEKSAVTGEEVCVRETTVLGREGLLIWEELGEVWIRCAWANGGVEAEDVERKGRWSISVRERMRTGVSAWKLGWEQRVRGVSGERLRGVNKRKISVWLVTGIREEETGMSELWDRVCSEGQEEEEAGGDEEELKEWSAVCDESSVGENWRESVAVGICLEEEDVWDNSCVFP